MSPPLVTIAITVYRRGRYLSAALTSALAQTVPVRVLVVDDAAPGVDHGPLLRPFVARGVVHHRNARTLGLVGNFNRCLELAETPWVTILHDDDTLLPDAVARLLGAVAAYPGRGLYFGNDETIDENDHVFARPVADATVRVVQPGEFALKNQFSFPGHLLNREVARAAGGFTSTLTMTSDWDLWTRLAIAPGAVKTGHVVAQCRQYWDEMRATSFLDVSGRRLPALANQLHRNRRHMRRAGLPAPPRMEARVSIGVQARRVLLDHAWEMTPRARRVYRLYSEQAPPESASRRWAYQLSPRLFGRLTLLLAWVKQWRRRLTVASS